MCGVAGDDGAVVGDDYADGFLAAAAAAHRFVINLRVAPFSLVQVLRPLAIPQLLDVEVLVVGGGVGDAPADPRVVAEVGEGRDAGEGQADNVELGAGDAVLVVGVGGVQRTVGIAGHQRLAGGGELSGPGPTVAAAVHFGEIVEGGGALGQFLQAHVEGPGCGGSGGQYQQVARLVSGEELSGLLRPHGLHHPRPPYLGLEDAHQDVAHLVDDETVPRLPRLRLDASDGVLGGQGAIPLIR